MTQPKRLAARAGPDTDVLADFHSAGSVLVKLCVQRLFFAAVAISDVELNSAHKVIGAQTSSRRDESFHC